MSFLVGTPEQIRAYALALDKAEGLPLRGVAVGMAYELPAEPEKDEHGNVIPTPGFTTQTCPDPEALDESSLCLTLSPELERHLGTTIDVGGELITIPRADDAAVSAELPEPLQLARDAETEAIALQLASLEEERG